MIIYSYTPKPKKTAEAIVVALCAISAAFLFSVSGLTQGLASAIFRLSSPVFVLLMIGMSSRFIICSHTYRLEEFEFTVVKCHPKRASVDCRISYSDIKEITTKKGLKAINLDGKVYNYCASLFPKDPLCLVYSDGDKLSAVVLERENTFAEMLLKRVSPDITLN